MQYIIKIYHYTDEILTEFLSIDFQQFEASERVPHLSYIGLRLYIAHEIVKVHGGTLTVEAYPSRGNLLMIKLS